MALATFLAGTFSSCGTGATAFGARFAGARLAVVGAPSAEVTSTVVFYPVTALLGALFFTARFRAAFGSIAITPNPHLGTELLIIGTSLGPKSGNSDKNCFPAGRSCVDFRLMWNKSQEIDPY